VAIPLRRNDKSPIRKGWKTDPELRATDLGEEWAWADPQMWKGCNVGIATEPSGLVVLDPDLKDGIDGIANLKALCHDLGVDQDEVFDTYTVRTPSGGLHLYFKAPEGAALAGRDLCEGVNTRSRGQLVVAAGSMINGVPYTVETDRPVRPLPAQFTARLTARAEDPDQTRVFTDEEATNFVETQALAPMREAIESRNIRLNDSAVVLGHFVPDYWTEDEAIEKLLEASIESGLLDDDGEAQCVDTIRSGLRKGMSSWTAVRPTAENSVDVGTEVSKLRLRDQAQREYDRERFPFASALADKHFAHGELLAAKYAEFRSNRVSFLVEGVIKERSYGALGAEYKAGKTWMLLDLMVSLAAGIPWMDHFQVTAPGRVAYMLGEGQEDEFFRRIEAICRHRRVKIERVLDQISLQVGSSNLSDPAQMERIYADLSIFRPALVIVDPWYLSAGEVDGKNIVVAGKVLDNIAGMARTLGSALLIAQHWNKTGQGASTARWAGSGLQEWSRFMINVAVRKYTGAQPYSLDASGQTNSELRVGLSGEISGDFTVERAVWTDDARKAESPMYYRCSCRELSDEEVEEEKASIESLLVRAVKDKGEPMTRMEVLKAAGFGSGRKYQEAGPVFDRMTVGSTSPLVEANKIGRNVYWDLRAH
jgi:hypothetical protein